MKGMIAYPDRKFFRWFRKKKYDKISIVSLISPGLETATRNETKPAHDSDRDIYLGKKIEIRK